MLKCRHFNNTPKVLHLYILLTTYFFSFPISFSKRLEGLFFFPIYEYEIFKNSDTTIDICKAEFICRLAHHPQLYQIYSLPSYML